MALIACLLLPLGLLAAPAQSREKASPSTTSLSATAPVPATLPAPVAGPSLATGRITLPSPRQAVRELRRSLTHAVKPARHSLAHIQLDRDLRLAVVERPHWSTTAPGSPLTFSLALLSLRW